MRGMIQAVSLSQIRDLMRRYEFFPRKRYPRSETVDFQRGEVETSNRNLYFDEWDYKMEVEYLD